MSRREKLDAFEVIDGMSEQNPPSPPRLRFKNFILSPNDIDRVEACPASGCYVGPKQDPGFGAWWGIFLHRFIEYAKTRDREQALDYIERKYSKLLRTCRAIDTDSIPDGRVEVALVYNTTTRELTTNNDDATPEHHVRGRADLIEDMDGGEPHVIDWKAGKQKIDPATSGQMRTLCAKLWAGMSEKLGPTRSVKASIVNVLSDGTLVWNTHRFDAKELEREAQRLRRVHLNVVETRAELLEDGEEPTFVPGAQCKWCRAKEVCPHASK